MGDIPKGCDSEGPPRAVGEAPELERLAEEGGEPLATLKRLCLEEPEWGREFVKEYKETLDRRCQCPECGHRFTRPVD